MKSIFCAYTIEKQTKDSAEGRTPITSPLGTSEGFSLSRQHGIWGTTTVKCTQVYSLSHAFQPFLIQKVMTEITFNIDIH